MENLSLDELKRIEDWYVCMTREYAITNEDDSLIKKVRQAIADREYEESKHFNLRP